MSLLSEVHTFHKTLVCYRDLGLGLNWQMGRASLCAIFSFFLLSTNRFFPSLCLNMPQPWIWNQTIIRWIWHVFSFNVQAFAKYLPFRQLQPFYTERLEFQELKLFGMTSSFTDGWSLVSLCHYKTNERVEALKEKSKLRVFYQNDRKVWRRESSMADALRPTGRRTDGQTMSINIILNFKGTEMEHFSVQSVISQPRPTDQHFWWYPWNSWCSYHETWLQL